MSSHQTLSLVLLTRFVTVPVPENRHPWPVPSHSLDRLHIPLFPPQPYYSAHGRNHPDAIIFNKDICDRQ